MTRAIFVIFFILLTAITLNAQQQEYQTRSIKNSGNGKEDQFNSLLFSADYSSNSSFLGSISQFVKQPSYSPSISYFHKCGFDITSTAFFIANSNDSLNDFTSELDIIAGYSFEPFRNFTLHPTYSHFFYSHSANLQKSIFSDEINIDADYTYNSLDLGLTAGYFLGKKNTFYAALHSSLNLEFNNFIFKNTLFSLQPGIDFNFGNYEYLNQFYLDELENKPLFYLYLLRSPNVRRYVYEEKITHPALTVKQIVDTYLNKQAEDNFKLTSVSINLPVNYMVGNFGFNLGLFICIPVSQPNYMSNDVQFYFDIGASYSLMSK